MEEIPAESWFESMPGSQTRNSPIPLTVPGAGIAKPFGIRFESYQERIAERNEGNPLTWTPLTDRGTEAPRTYDLGYHGSDCVRTTVKGLIDTKHEIYSIPMTK